MYPATSSSLYDDAGPTDDQLRGLLRAVDLDHLLTREGGLDASVVWQDQLSVGEQQRIGFIRMLYHKCVLCVSVFLSLPLNRLTPMAWHCRRLHRPRYAIMDESTSALDLDLEMRCMNMLKEAGITCISVAHRPTLIPFHKRVLVLDGHAGFVCRPISSAVIPPAPTASGAAAGAGAGAGTATGTNGAAE